MHRRQPSSQQDIWQGSISSHQTLTPGAGATAGGAPLRYIWLPYILIFKHRGLSHNPVIGPLTRLLYLGALIIGITSLLNIALPTPSIPPLNTALFLLLGYWTPSVVHWLVDKKI
ncbi:MAG: hypothetical protein D6733_01355 [Methanobacteriota archaeon]|nr:MAG: hypothetical protein D6733_01355 [Euryarchaeota archaeon]